MKIRIPKWSDFQQYRDRKPPWIKLHRQLLDNRQWALLSGEAAKMLVEIWLIASESDDGTIAIGTEDLAWRRHRDPAALDAMLVELELHGFVELSVRDNSTAVRPHPSCTDPYELVQKRTSETEVETEVEVEVETENIGSKAKPKKTRLPDSWAPIESHLKKAAELGVDLADQAERFRLFHASKGNTFVDWDLAFHTWLRNAPTYSRPSLRVVNGNSGRPASSNGKDSAGSLERGRVTHPVEE